MTLTLIIESLNTKLQLGTYRGFVHHEPVTKHSTDIKQMGRDGRPHCSVGHAAGRRAFRFGAFGFGAERL